MNIEHENTVRTLKDEELIVDSPWCRFGIHRWLRWDEGQWIKDRSYSSKKHYVICKRCVHCNTLRVRYVGLESQT